MLGAHDSSELDRPDLNKCPDCECFFATNTCPLCGKVCPEEMRAGNRKPPKKEKRRRSSSGRVTFVEWYHSWWFIILMMFVMPIVGIILLATSPHSKKAKITFIVLGAVYLLISTIGIGTIIGGIINLFDKPVDTSLTREEYIAKCETVTPQDIWYAPEDYKNEFVSLTVTISEKIEGVDDYYFASESYQFYICKIDGKSNAYIYIRNCIQSGASHFSVGDTVTFYGEGDGLTCIFTYEYGDIEVPCVNAAYATLTPNENN